MFRSAIVKLMFWYVLLITGLSVVFSAALYQFSAHELKEVIGQQNHTVLLHSPTINSEQRAIVEFDNHTQNIVRDLVYFNIVVFVASIVTSYELARRTLRPIEKAHQAQLRFTAEASHELRTPLAAMKADTEATLLDTRSTKQSLQTTLKENLNDIEKLETLANHLLELSRYESNIRKPMKTIDLDEVISESILLFKNTAKKQNLKLLINLVPLQVKGDHQALKQLVTIIIDNAVKYTPKNGLVDIHSYSSGKWAIISIKDNGVGIAKNDLPHIFERFYRSQKNTSKTQKIEGYGLGLSLAKEIVTLHEGTIAIDSTEHKGTTVVIKLPLVTTS